MGRFRLSATATAATRHATRLWALSATTLAFSAAQTAAAATSTFAFDAASGPITGYYIYYDSESHAEDELDLYDAGFAGEGASPIAVPLTSFADPETPQFTFTNVPACTHLHVRVVAFSNTATGPPSEEGDWSVPTRVTGVQANPGAAEGALFISWASLPAEDTTGLSQLAVHYDGDAGQPYDGADAWQGPSPVSIDASALSFQLEALPPGATIHVAIEAICPDGASLLSDDVTGTVALPLCGNDIVETGETCDPPASCPATCDDGNPCTIDGMSGSADSCNAACSYSVIGACASGDACCPAGCNNTNDSDCSPSCGNGTLESGETCDPYSTCPTECAATGACMQGLLTGSSGNCNVVCTEVPIQMCIDGDGCCPLGCNDALDDDCEPSCGFEQTTGCDPPPDCPVTCDDADPCTSDVVSPGFNGCDISCSRALITECTLDDYCCPPGCAEVGDNDCGAEAEKQQAPISVPSPTTVVGSSGCQCELGASSAPVGELAWLMLILVALLARRGTGTRTWGS